MLINLSIQNVAVIEKAEVDFSDGFNILTGETGAGKSLLIDSLSMVLGMRTSRDLVRNGADSATVTALFSSDMSLEEYDIPQEDDGNIVLSRKISQDGKNICKINYKTVPLSILKAVGEKLVSIHGQHDNIALLKPAFHLSFLDEYASLTPLVEEFRTLFRKATKARDELKNLRKSESEREMQKDTLSFRINEIKDTDPQEGEDDLLSSKRDSLRNFSIILANVEETLSSLSTSRDALYSAMNTILRATGYDQSLSDISESITDLYYSSDDALSRLSSISSRMEFSPEQLDEIEERLDKLTRLKKKYGPTLEDVLKNLSDWEEEYGSLLFYDDNFSALEKEADALWAEMLESGQKLQSARQKAADTLSSAIEDELSFLDMPRVKFTVMFTEHAPSSNGLFDAEFMIATNPSEGVKPLSKIASGGEMSRIMLALKSALASIDDVPCLLFDEIDSGVSGKAAAKIAVKLKSLAKERQIICITHLPQMASKADSHFLIQKDTSTDSFKTTVTLLDRNGRIDELSRLISGDEITESARKAAEEMLD